MSVRSFLRATFGGHSDAAPYGGRAVTVAEVGTEEFRAHLPAAMSIWARAMGYPLSLVAPRTLLASSHLDQPDLRALLARDESGQLVGFVYGYRSAPGQWWHDEVHRLAEQSAAQTLLRWLPGSYELCELHVSPDAQGRGIGRRLLEDFLAVVPNDRVLLSTPEGPTAAVGLYESTGFCRLGEGFRFTGDARPFSIYGRAVAPGSSGSGSLGPG